MMTDLTISKTTLRRYRHNFQRIYDFRQHVAPPTFDYEAPVAEDRVPNAWQPIGPTSEEEVVFLAPLDIVSARGRAKWLFDFEYIWKSTNRPAPAAGATIPCLFFMATGWWPASTLNWTAKQARWSLMASGWKKKK